MSRNKPLHQSGFTIVELMISTAVFSAVLLVCSFAIVYVGRLYFKGSITSRTQDVSRRTGEDITQAIQFGVGGDPRGNSTGVSYGSVLVKSYCMGEIRYSYSTDRPMGDGTLLHVLWKDRVASDYAACLPLNLTLNNPGTTPGGNSTGGGEELLGTRMRVPLFSVTKNVANSNLFDIDIIISYGDAPGVFAASTPSYTICKGVNASGDFCAVAAYRTKVGRRL